MRTAILRFRRFVNYSPYPNAATPKQTLHRVLDILLVTASGAGMAATLLLLLAMV